MTKKRILSLTLFAVMLICAIAAISVAKNNSVYSATLVFDEENALKARYFENDTLTLPSAKLSVDGTEYAAEERVIYYPNGKAYSNNTHTLSDLGEYSVEYFATVNGKKISDSTQFTVVKDVYGVSGGATATAVDTLTKKQGDNDGGISVSVPEGGKFVYNQPINISSYDRSTPIIEIYPYNKNSVLGYDENGTRVVAEEAEVQARIFVLRITDCYDENNYIEVYADWNLNNPGDPILGTRREATFTAAANGQLKTSLLPNPSNSTNQWYANKTVDGAPYLLTMGSSYGKDCAYDQSTGISIYYEYNTKRVYIKGKSEYLLTDLDDPDLYFTTPLTHNGKSYITGSPFKGFATGEVYISCYYEEYYKSSADFEIASICGISGKSLSEREVNDNVKPIISVDVKEGEILIAQGEEFKIFNATASDLSGIKEFDSKVYYDYGGERQALIGVKNNAFTPLIRGVYTIEYTATDIFGNTTVKTVDLLSVNSASGKTIDFTLDALSSYGAGALHELSYSASGINGDVKVSAYAVYSENEDKTTLGVTEDYIEFEPTEIGKYTIYVVCTDGVVEKTLCYEIEATASENVYLTKPILPEYLIAGAEYTLDYNRIYYYDGVTESKNPTVYAIADGSEKVLIDYENYSVPESADYVKFAYYDGETFLGESDAIEVVKVKDEGSLVMSKYFKGDFTARATASFIEFTSNKTDGDNEMVFINAVSLGNFGFKFSTGVGDFSAFDITLINYYDRSERFTYSLYANNANTEIALKNADGKVLETTAVAKTFYDSTFYLLYNSKTGMSESGSNAGVAPISSDKVLVHFTMRGLSGKGSVRLRQLNNQALNNLEFDTYGATFTLYSAEGKVEKGSEITIVAPDVSDVLSPYLKRNFKMTVSDANGEIMTAVDGTVLDDKCDPTKSYTVKLKEYGSYTIRYTYTDWAKTVPETVTIEVLDRIPPEIKLNDGIGENTLIKTSAGKKFSLSLIGYEVSDNNTPKDKLTVAVIVMNPRNEAIKVDGELELDLKGEYKVYYYCYDEYGNFAYTYFTISAI